MLPFFFLIWTKQKKKILTYLSPACNLQWFWNSAFKISRVFGFAILTSGLCNTSPPISCLSNLRSPKRRFADGQREFIDLEFGLSHRPMWPRALILKRYGVFRFFVLLNPRSPIYRFPDMAFLTLAPLGFSLVHVTSSHKTTVIPLFLSGNLSNALISSTRPPMMDILDLFSWFRDFKCSGCLMFRIHDFPNPVMPMDSPIGIFS